MKKPHKSMGDKKYLQGFLSNPELSPRGIGVDYVHKKHGEADFQPFGGRVIFYPDPDSGNGFYDPFMDEKYDDHYDYERTGLEIHWSYRTRSPGR